MGDFAARLAKLNRETQESRYQFLKVELRTCFNAVDFGALQLEQGDREYAAREILAAEKGYSTILRFLPGLDGEERRSEIESALSRLGEVINRLRKMRG